MTRTTLTQSILGTPELTIISLRLLTTFCSALAKLSSRGSQERVPNQPSSGRRGSLYEDDEYWPLDPTLEAAYCVERALRDRRN